jgi:hypothetical protein
MYSVGLRSGDRADLNLEVGSRSFCDYSHLCILVTGAILNWKGKDLSEKYFTFTKNISQKV